MSSTSAFRRCCQASSAPTPLELLAPAQEPCTFCVLVFLQPPAFLLLMFEFDKASGGGVRIEAKHLFREPTLVHAIGEIEHVSTMLAQGFG